MNQVSFLTYSTILLKLAQTPLEILLNRAKRASPGQLRGIDLIGPEQSLQYQCTNHHAENKDPQEDQKNRQDGSINLDAVGID